MTELKPTAWIVYQYGCRTPDDCEEYEEIMSAEEFDAVPNKDKYLQHGMAAPLYDIPEGCQMVPIHANNTMRLAGQAAMPTTAYHVYKAMLKAAGDQND